MNTDPLPLITSIHQARKQLRKTANAMREAYSSIEAATAFISEYFELESINEQGAGKPQRSIADILANEEARAAVSENEARMIKRDAQSRQRAWDKWIAKGEQLEFTPPERASKPDEYRDGLIEKYKKQGLTFDEPLPNRDAQLPSREFIKEVLDHLFGMVSDPWDNPSGKLNQWLEKEHNEQGLNFGDAQQLVKAPTVEDPWEERYLLSYSDVWSIFNWAKFRDQIAVYEDYILEFDCCHSFFRVVVRLNNDVVHTWTCPSTYSKVKSISSKIKEWIDAQVATGQPEVKSLEAAKELAAAFFWVDWHVVQPSGLVGYYRHMRVNIRQSEYNYVFYYGDCTYTFPKRGSMLIISQNIKTRIDFDYSQR